MSDIRRLSEILPAECAVDLRKSIGLFTLPAAGKTAKILGVDCNFELLGDTPDADTVILCAQPVDNQNWDFGTLFPQLPGAWAQGNFDGAFHLRYLRLAGSVWIYIWTRNPDRTTIENKLSGIKRFSDWAEDNSFKLEKYGLETNDLEAVPVDTPRVVIAKPTKPAVLPSWSMMAFWGSLADSLLVIEPEAGLQEPAQSEAILEQIKHFLGNTTPTPTFRAKLRFDTLEGGDDEPSYLFRRLTLETPPITTEVEGGFELADAAISVSAPLYYTKDNARIGVHAALKINETKRVDIDIDYPIYGDLIRAKGLYVGDPEHLLGESAALGLPGEPPQFGSETEIFVGLEFSKSDKSLRKLSFDLELRNKDWTLIPAPIDMTLDAVSVQVDVFSPLDKEGGRFLRAKLAVATTIGGGDTPLRLLGGGTYPEADLYLQATSELPVGKLLEKLIGPNPELEGFTIDDLRIEHNYRSSKTALSFDVPETWPVVGSLALGDLQFRIQGGNGVYRGGASAKLSLDMGEGGPLEISLSALHDDGWQFEGSTGPGQKIPVGHVFGAIKTAFRGDCEVPACLDALTVSDLSLFFNTATHDVSFRCLLDAEIEGADANLDLNIAIAHHKDPTDDAKMLAETRVSGALHFMIEGRAFEFDVVFGEEPITLPDRSDVDVSTFLAAFRSTDGDAPNMKEFFAPGRLRELTPPVKTNSAFLVRQSRKGASKNKTTKSLLGFNLEAGLDLSNVKLPNIPLVGSNGPPKSLKLDLQLLLPLPKEVSFDTQEMGVVGKLNVDGGVSLPTDGVPGIVVASSITMDGKVLKLNLPLKANPTAPVGGVGFQKDKSLIGGPEAPQPVPNMVAQGADTKWVKIQKSFGPIQIERIGVRYADEKLYVTLDAGLTAAGFSISLHGLGLDTPLAKFDPHFHISGLGLKYASGGVEIGAALLKQEMTDPADAENSYTAYAGQAVLKTPAMSLSALGSFANVHDEPSLFVYAELDQILGGPGFFYVTGLAAGFGYHRRAIVPAIDQIHAYPLVTKAIAGPVERDVDGKAKEPDLATELGRLEAYLPPDPGELFFSVGVKFTSFEMVDSFALLIAQFGDQTQFDVLGVSQMQVPAKPAGGASAGTPLAEIYMNWHGYLHPDEGAMGLDAQLAAGSYVFSRDCHLTGGFAYASWFKGEHANDFVLTVGGYHPDYERPDHYPTVPRLSFSWNIPSAHLSMEGELYFALAAHAFMAGGALNASIHGGFDIGIAGVDFHADVNIVADFLITWEPYHYDGAASIDLDIGLTAHLLMFSKSFSLNVGGDIHIWGPDFAGEAHIHLKVWKISHTIGVKFGAGPSNLVPITWERFEASFLPKKHAPKDGKAKVARPPAIDADKVCSVILKGGLVSQTNDRWVVNAHEFCLETNSVIPSNNASIGDRMIAGNGLFSDIGPKPGHRHEDTISNEVGIAPMGLHPSQLISTHKIHILQDKNIVVDRLFRCEPITKRVPTAIWGRPNFTDQTERYLAKPELNPADSYVTNAMVGLRVLPAQQLHPSQTDNVDRRELLYDTDRIEGAFQWTETPDFNSDADASAEQVLKDTLPVREKGLSGASDRRAAIIAELELKLEPLSFAQPVTADLVDYPQIEAL